MLTTTLVSSTNSTLSHLECVRCHQIYDSDQLNNVCSCSSPLLARYNLKKVQSSLSKFDISKRPPNMWRYRELLPVRQYHHIVSLEEGYTPLYQLPKLGQFLKLQQLLIKDESTNPGGTFKARGAVQAEGCAPLEKAFQAKKKESEFFHKAHTFATGLRVPKSCGDFIVLEAIYATNGYVVSVSDHEIRNGIELASKLEGIFLCPEAAIVIPGLKKLIEQGIISADEQVVIMGTGSGLKYHVSLNTPSLKILNH